MLQPANRLTLIEAMRPPAGFVFESAMAVTYTLNLSALLAVPAVLTLSARAEDADDDEALDPVELIHALRSHAGKLTVFSQAGEIALPPSRPIFAFLEQAVVPVTAPRGGIVHPKIWVLRYEAAEPADGREPERRLRVLVASRNLTFDTSWDTVVRLDETTGRAETSLTPIGGLFEALLGRCPAGVSEDHRMRVHSLAAALKDARFAMPAGVADLKVHVLGLEPRPSPLPPDADQSLIISPFVSDDFFTSVHPFRIDELVGRSQSLDSLKTSSAQDSGPTSEPGCRLPESLARVGKVYVFDDGSLLITDAEDDRRAPDDPGRPLIGLHAKVFAFEKDSRARLFLGSANATGPAFRNNLEVLIELVGSVAALGIDRLCEGTDDEPGLRDLFYDYRPSPDPTPPNGTTSLDRLRHEIAQLQITGQVEPSSGRRETDGSGATTSAGHTDDNRDSWSVTYRSRRPLPAQEGVEIHCWPLATAGNRRRVTGGEPLQARFVTSLEAISGFLAFELVAADMSSYDVSSFVVPVPLEGVPEEREPSLLRLLIGNAERFFRYLMALLDEDAGEVSLVDAVKRIGDDTASEGAGAVSLPVLERLLRTMRRDPDKLAGLHPLVSDLAADNALPSRFAELWEMIHQVATTEGPAQ